LFTSHIAQDDSHASRAIFFANEDDFTKAPICVKFQEVKNEEKNQKNIQAIMKKIFRLLLLVNLTVLPATTYAQASGGSVTQTLPNDSAPQLPLAKCLPAGIKLSDVVEATIAGYANGQPVESHKVTVEEKLNSLKATCNSDNKLVDGNGKQIVFYHLTGCWGNPPADYQEILQKQRAEIDKLKQQYTVIEMTCNPSGAHIS
jgi:hypothetical protein